MLSEFTAAEGSPVSPDEAESQLLLGDLADQHPLLELMCMSAAERGELATNRAFLTQTWDWMLDCFPNCDYLILPKPPLQEIVHVQYRDTSGNIQTFDSSNYRVTAPAGARAPRGILALKQNATWSSTISEKLAVTIRFTCGYGDKGTDVPHMLRAAMLMDIATLWANREDFVKGTIVAEVPMNSKRIYKSYRSHPVKVYD